MRYADLTPEQKANRYRLVKEWRARNKDVSREELRQSLKLRRSLAFKRAWPVIVDYYGSHCLACGAGRPIFDHVVPLSRGGHNLISNGQPLCKSCNTTKGHTEAEKDYRPDGGRFIKELVNANPWLEVETPGRGWHLTIEGRKMLRAMQETAVQPLIMPECWARGVGN